MANLNKVSIIGNLGKDPVHRTLDGGGTVCDFSVAVNDKRKKDGEWEEFTLWFKVTTWGAQADNVSKYLKKGSPVYVDGRLGVETWTDSENNNRFTFTVNAQDVRFLGSGEKKEEGATHSGAAPAPALTPISGEEVPEFFK